MKQYLEHDEWKIIENGFHPEFSKESESIFSIGNGRFGQRANFEEHFSGNSLQGSYIAGVYYPDKTKVGWWKNGYPEYFAKVLNAPNWIGIDIEFDGEKLDLNKGKLLSFSRVLDMKQGCLERNFTLRMVSGRTVEVKAKRFCSIASDEIGAISYTVKLLDFSGTISMTPYIDGDIANQDSNYEEKFWIGIESETKKKQAYLIEETKKTGFRVCTGMKFEMLKNGASLDFDTYKIEKEKFVGCVVETPLKEGDSITLYKYAAILSSLNYDPDVLLSTCKEKVKAAFDLGFDRLFADHTAAWAKKWEEADIVIKGDVAAQQAIRFNIFQLYQTYTGEDERLNIGPKGFTGEKYGGSTYWDTEAYCIPFYLSTADQHVARNLLIYRYKHLQKAIENAQKLGFKDGAALYPMVTINGEECHNEWEITFEEIHRNGAIAFAIYNYINYTGDKAYMAEFGLEVLIGIARFWAQRVHFSKQKNKYVMHGVTGPNEYENNVNNNWYTNYLAVWCLKYAIESIEMVKQLDQDKFEALTGKIKFYPTTETNQWQAIIDNMYFPYDDELQVFVQHDGFLDKELMKASDLDTSQRPINQKWSWDRILRSCFIKQADVLQGLFFFEDHFDQNTLLRNFEFYEPMTVHESSLSPCVHAILAAKVGKKEKAYEMYLRTARLDLDDYNNDTEDGLHITSMAGTWMAVVLGFGGLRVHNDTLVLNPFVPEQWQELSFNIRFRGKFLKISASHQKIEMVNHSEEPLSIKLLGQEHLVGGNGTLSLSTK